MSWSFLVAASVAETRTAVGISVEGGIAVAPAGCTAAAGGTAAEASSAGRAGPPEKRRPFIGAEEGTSMVPPALQFLRNWILLSLITYCRHYVFCTLLW